jgi:hypothetical protein
MSIIYINYFNCNIGKRVGVSLYNKEEGKELEKYLEAYV